MMHKPYTHYNLKAIAVIFCIILFCALTVFNIKSLHSFWLAVALWVIAIAAIMRTLFIHGKPNVPRETDYTQKQRDWFAKKGKVVKMNTFIESDIINNEK